MGQFFIFPSCLWGYSLQLQESESSCFAVSYQLYAASSGVLFESCLIQTNSRLTMERSINTAQLTKLSTVSYFKSLLL